MKNVNIIKLKGGYVLETYFENGEVSSEVFVSETKVLKYLKDLLAKGSEEEAE